MRVDHFRCRPQTMPPATIPNTRHAPLVVMNSWTTNGSILSSHARNNEANECRDHRRGQSPAKHLPQRELARIAFRPPSARVNIPRQQHEPPARRNENQHRGGGITTARLAAAIANNTSSPRFICTRKGKRGDRAARPAASHCCRRQRQSRKGDPHRQHADFAADKPRLVEINTTDGSCCDLSIATQQQIPERDDPTANHSQTAQSPSNPSECSIARPASLQDSV